MRLDGLGDLQVHDVQKCCFIRLADSVDGLEVGQKACRVLGPTPAMSSNLNERGLAAALAVMLQ